jgi:hypothetical protein
MKSVLPFLVFASCFSVSAQEFGSAAYCGQLADVGANAYRTKKEGHSMETVLQKVGYVLSDNPQKKQAAQGVVIAVYGDGSIKSPKQAYDIVYSACKR